MCGGIDTWFNDPDLNPPYLPPPPSGAPICSNVRTCDKKQGGYGPGGGSSGGLAKPILTLAQLLALSAMGRTKTTFSVGTKPVDNANTSAAPAISPVGNSGGSSDNGNDNNSCL